MRCHYEVLELDQDADEAEIKGAYRRLALRLHPDKNLDNPNLAKEQFQVVQQAYEVLSDRQERAWYDAHREQILHGADSQFEAQNLDVFQYFTNTCFKGFGDDPQGFYAVYCNVFEQIAKEDIEFMEDKEEFCEIPAFGSAESDYEVVKRFYDHWMSYSTKKSYSWLDPYDISQGKGYRRAVKFIDKENKKVRLRARKERNEEVRNLVAFVRKRDKRVKAFQQQMESKVLENRRKQQEHSNRRKLERAQMHANEKQADWLKFDNVQSELEAIEKQLAQQFGERLSQSEEDQNEAADHLYCIACNKVFKNSKAFQNHESSKKHRDSVLRLRETLIQEDLQYENAQQASGLEEDDLAELSCSNCDQDDSRVKTSKKKRKPAQAREEAPSPDVDIGHLSQEEFNFEDKRKPKKKSRRSNNRAEEASEQPPSKPAKQKARKKERVPIELDVSHCCATCTSNFPSKNKLFEHLNTTNHGVYLPAKGNRATLNN